MASRFPSPPAAPIMGPMVDVLRILLGVLVVASLVTIAAYVVLFFLAAIWTLIRGPRRDPLREELDQLLAEVLGPRCGGSDSQALAASPGGERAGDAEPGWDAPFSRVAWGRPW